MNSGRRMDGSAYFIASSVKPAYHGKDTLLRDPLFQIWEFVTFEDGWFGLTANLQVGPRRAEAKLSSHSILEAHNDCALALKKKHSGILWGVLSCLDVVHPLTKICHGALATCGLHEFSHRHACWRHVCVCELIRTHVEPETRQRVYQSFNIITAIKKQPNSL